jgi:ADP-heptose:LPS heptosyltransferase
MAASFQSRFQLCVESAAIALFSLLVRPAPRRKTKLLLFKPDRLGDLIVIAPHLQAMIAHFGAENTILVLSEANQAAARLLFPTCEQIVVPLYLPLRRWREWLSFMRGVAAIDADHALFFRHYMRFPHTKAMWRVARAQNKRWVKSAEGHVTPPASDTWLMNGQPLVITTPPAFRESIETHIARVLLATVCGSDTLLSPLPRPLFPAPAPEAPSGNYAVVFPFSNSPLRDLPAAMSQAIVSHLAQDPTQAVVLCGTRDRQTELAQIALIANQSFSAGQPGRIRVFIPPSFGAFYQTILDARIVISTDTGSAHIAILHDCLFVGILGGGQYGIFAPWSVSDRQRWVSHPLPCYGCDWICKFDRAHCVTDIPIAAITAAIDDVLHQAPIA